MIFFLLLGTIVIYYAWKSKVCCGSGCCVVVAGLRSSVWGGAAP